MLNIYAISGANVSTTIFYIDHHIILWALCMDALSHTRLALHRLEKLRCRNDRSFHGNYDVFSPYPETLKEGKLC